LQLLIGEVIVTNVIGYDKFWQYPAITEKHAYKMAKKYLQNYDRSIVYFGFPWASLIDHLVFKTEDAKHFLFVLERYKFHLKQFNRVVTVCQHIKLLQFQHLFKEAGVTNVFWSHAIKDCPTFPDFQEIKIHPFPLFPVQASDVSPNDWRSILKKNYFVLLVQKLIVFT
jgi:hypothetical protein